MPNPLIPASAQEAEDAWLRYKDDAKEEGYKHVSKHSFMAGYRIGAAGTGKDAAFRRTHEFLKKRNVELTAENIDLKRESGMLREHLRRIAAAVKSVGEWGHG